MAALLNRLTRGLQVQLLLLVIVPTALVLILVTLGGAMLHEQAMRELVGSRDAHAAKAAADHIDERLRQRELVLAMAASSQPLDLENPQLRSLFDYGLLLTQDRRHVVTSWFPEEDWQWRVIRDETLAFVGHNQHQTIAVFVAPLPDGTGRLYGATSLEGLGIPTLLDNLLNDDGTLVYLIDQDGHVLYKVGNDTHAGQQLTEYPEVAASIQGKAGYQHVEGDIVRGYSPVPRLEWGLVMEEPWDHVSTRRLRVANLALLVPVIVVLLGAGVVAFSALGIIRPLQRLQARASQLVKGDFNAILDPVGGIHEIADLQDALVQMAGAVQQAQARLHDYIGAITTAQEDERTRLARDLHDDTIQTLIALNQQAQMAQRTLEGNPTLAHQRLSEIRTTAENAVQDIRRMVHGLRPTYLAELGLVSALEMLVEQESLVPITLQISGAVQRLPDTIELALYRIAQEAVANIRKHSQAQQADIQLDFEPQKVCLRIQDNGCGFVMRHAAGHYGLVGIQERAQLIHADLHLNSLPGAGTTLHISVPIP